MTDKVQDAIEYFTEYLQASEQLTGMSEGTDFVEEHYRTVLAALTRLQNEDEKGSA